MLKDVEVKYEKCKRCGFSSCISSCQPGIIIGLRALKTNITKKCNRCKENLVIRCIKAKVVEEGLK